MLKYQHNIVSYSKTTVQISCLVSMEIGFWRTRTSNEFGLIALEDSDHMPGEFGPTALENSA